MARTFQDYAEQRGKRMSAEGRAALEAFRAAEAIGVALHKARTTAGLNQTELSELSGVTQADISRIERGKIAPTTVTLMKLVHAMGGEFRIAVPRKR